MYFLFRTVIYLIAIYVILYLSIITYNLNDSRMLHIDESFFSAIFTIDIFHLSFYVTFYIFFNLFTVLYSYIKNKLFTVTFEYAIILLFSMLGMVLILVSNDF